MAITSCPECNGKVSTTVTSCPHCGYAISEEQPRKTEEEVVFLSERGVTVTKQRFILPAQTYALNLISSVRAETVPAPRGVPGLFLLVGVGLGLYGMFDNKNTAEITWGVIITLISIIWLIKLRATYWIVVQTAGAESRTLSSQDWGFINRIVKALNDAIIARG